MKRVDRNSIDERLLNAVYDLAGGAYFTPAMDLVRLTDQPRADVISRLLKQGWLAQQPDGTYKISTAGLRAYDDSKNGLLVDPKD